MEANAVFSNTGRGKLPSFHRGLLIPRLMRSCHQKVQSALWLTVDLHESLILFLQSWKATASAMKSCFGPVITLQEQLASFTRKLYSEGQSQKRRAPDSSISWLNWLSKACSETVQWLSKSVWTDNGIPSMSGHTPQLTWVVLQGAATGTSKLTAFIQQPSLCFQSK